VLLAFAAIVPFGLVRLSKDWVSMRAASGADRAERRKQLREQALGLSVMLLVIGIVLNFVRPW
jgi:hypothetical protein